MYCCCVLLRYSSHFDIVSHYSLLFFFFNDPATTEIYTLSLHDALPIWRADAPDRRTRSRWRRPSTPRPRRRGHRGDRKSTRLNSSHGYISYAVFCLKKKKDSVQRAYRQSREIA